MELVNPDKVTEIRHERPAPFQSPMIFTFQDEFDFLSESLPIDRNKLPELLENQSALIDMAGECLNKASRQFNQIKLLVDTREAEVYLDIRRNSATKMTEAELAASVASHVEIVGLKQAKLEAEDIKNRWLNRKMSFESRGRDAHDLVSLYVSGYSKHN